MAKTFDLDNLEGEVFLTPSIGEKDYAYSLLHSSAYDDDQKAVIDDELSDELTMDRFNEIVHDLKMNQSDSPNPSMTEIKRQLDKRLKREL